MMLATARVVVLLEWLLLAGIVVWLLWRWLKRSADDPGWLISKWLLTGGLLVAAVFAALIAAGNPFVGVPLVAACGVVIGVL